MYGRILKLWTEALRSGDYKQHRGGLRGHSEAGMEYCCLGVLCNLHSKEHPDTQWERGTVYMGKEKFLPLAVAEWAGVTDDMLTSDGNESMCDGFDIALDMGAEYEAEHPSHSTCAGVNDRRHSFSEIADILEEKFANQNV